MPMDTQSGMMGVELANNPLQSWRCLPMYGMSAFNGCDLRELHSPDQQSLIPNSLPADPRHWTHPQVCQWLEYCVQQFSLPQIDLENFHMNGRALCLLTKGDFKHRVPRVGDVLFNSLHILIHKLAPPPTTPNVSNLLIGQAAASAIEKGAFLNGYWSRSANDLQALNGLMAQGDSNTSSGGDVDSTVILSPAPSNEGHVEHAGGKTNGASVDNGASDEEEEGHVMHNLVQTQALSLVTQPSPDVPQEKSVRLLWDFLQQLLNDPEGRYRRCITWKDQSLGIFKIVDPHQLATLWGMQKNHLNMNFDKMSRALRYYYRVKILQKEPGERHCYRFLRHPSELRNCKQRSLLMKSKDISSRPSEGALDMSIKDEWNSPPTVTP